MTFEGQCALDSGFKIQEQAKNMLKQICLCTIWEYKLKMCLWESIWNPVYVDYLRIRTDDG